ncbi:MAG TPA: peptidase M23 [Candidatus Tenderia electrophaga]|uniref:Peptidase M23 n=1 Tax=Candidatus Tenderia electrophaga TaxID=1748243 RepID=A0A832J2K3_9GAMM|nr:peptidase M23 [Candidatus Tenderia electrophaga]
MRISRRQLGFAWALSLSLGFSPSPSKAEQPAPQKRLQQIRDNISEIKQNLGNDKKQQQQQQQQLSKLEKDIARLSQAQQKIKQQLKHQKKEQQQLSHDTNQLRQRLKQQQHKLSQQIQTTYSAGQMQQLKLLLNQTNPAAAGRNMIYYNYFNRAQLNAVNQTQHNIQQLNNNEKQLQKSKRKLEKLKQQQQRQQLKLQQHQSQRKQLLSKLDSEINSKQQRLERLREDEKSLRKLLQSLPTQTQEHKTSSNLSQLKGKLKWPTKGKIKNRFGSPRNQGQLKWQGITIAGKAGQEVRSIASGRVIFADWIRGYGLMLIIDHGHGYMSLYGHNQSLYKDLGDTISANESIASLGNSGGNSSTGLYFEMRHKGKPINPATWCR